MKNFLMLAKNESMNIKALLILTDLNSSRLKRVTEIQPVRSISLDITYDRLSKQIR